MNKTATFIFAILISICANAEWKFSDAKISDAEKIPFAHIAGHTHRMRKAGASEELSNTNLFEWAKKHSVDACGIGSPWTANNRDMTRYHETKARDEYYSGKLDSSRDKLMAQEENEKMIEELNRLGNGTLYYLDNETPKSHFGHLWYIGFKQLHPSWHDYNQDCLCWYSPYDDNKAEKNSITLDYHKRRTYSTIVKEQRDAGAIAIWAHPTSWWTTDGKNKGPFVTNIATDMIPQLMRDGYLDGMTVQGYDKYHRDYQALWFALLDLGYRVPGFSELDISPCHGLNTKDAMLLNHIPFPQKPLTLDFIIKECKKAHHTMSSGPSLLLKVDGLLQGCDIESSNNKTHKIEVLAFPANEEKTLSRVQLLGRGGRLLAEVRDFSGGRITWNLTADDEGGYLVARVFGENDADFENKRQQEVTHCAITNPVWLRTNRFRAPQPINTPDPMTIPAIRELEDFLLKGTFRFDKRVTKELSPGEVPVWAFQIDKIRDALINASK